MTVDLKAKIRDVPDFPQQGVVFRDIMPLLADAEALRQTIDELGAWAKTKEPDLILGAEARGFILGAAIAYEIGCGFVAARRPGKLPPETVSATYALEYGQNALELHPDLIPETRKRPVKILGFGESYMGHGGGLTDWAAESREMVKRALKIGKGTAKLLDARKRATVLSTEMSCPSCGQSFEELDPRLFSFNSPHGWCEECHGFGEVWKAYVDPKLESAIEIELAQERQHESLEEGEATPCPSCHGARLNEIARHVEQYRRRVDLRLKRYVTHFRYWQRIRTASGVTLHHVAQRSIPSRFVRTGSPGGMRAKKGASRNPSGPVVFTTPAGFVDCAILFERRLANEGPGCTRGPVTPDVRQVLIGHNPLRDA